MEILYGPDFCISNPTVITIGKFDGLHIGHKKIISELCNTAKEHGLKSVVYTFNTNPKIVLNQENIIPIMSNEDKSNEIEKLGVDYLIYEDFNLDFSKMEPEAFVKNILVDKLNVKALVMGENSTFGKDRKGNINTMIKLSKKYKFKLNVVKLITENGRVVSSTLIRNEVRKKEIVV